MKQKKSKAARRNTWKRLQQQHCPCSPCKRFCNFNRGIRQYLWHAGSRLTSRKPRSRCLSWSSGVKSSLSPYNHLCTIPMVIVFAPHPPRGPDLNLMSCISWNHLTQASGVSKLLRAGKNPQCRRLVLKGPRKSMRLTTLQTCVPVLT